MRWVWLLVFGCSTPAPSIAAHADDLAIIDVSVVPMSSDGVLAHQTVIIRGERIVAVAPTAMLTLPAGITVIDGKGNWLMPGLADMHVHTWRDDDLTMFVAAGVTTIRNMWGIEQHLRWRSQIARGERLGPTIITAGPLIDGDPPDWPGSTVLTNPADADKIVVEQKAAGYDFLKSVNQLSREAYAALVAAAKQHDMRLSGHVPNAVGVDGVLAAHQRSIEHLDGYLAALVPPDVVLPPFDDGEVRDRAVLAKLDLSRLPALIERTIAAGTWNCPTLIAFDRISKLDHIAGLRAGVQWLDKLPAAMTVRWTPLQNYTAEDYATVRASNTQLAKVLVALFAANAPILVGTDTGVSFVVPGEALHAEIELMVAAGVPRPRVLRAATADAWRYLGMPHEAGVVEVGSRADLVLVSSDPLTAPLPLIPDAVIVRGKALSRAELEAKLADIVKREAAPKQGIPALAGESAHYDIAIDGTTVGEERLAIDKRTIVGQIADLSEHIDTSYKVGPDSATIAATYHGTTLALAGTVAGGTLVVTGTDLTGKSLSINKPVPAGGFLSAPGIAGSIQLVEKLAGMKPGTKRTLMSLELGYFPAIEIISARYEVERKPDAAGHRVFAVTVTRSGTTVTGEIVVDDGGLVVTETLGTTTFTRR
jgi:imidazolonepropionase-like amidohydrolase